MSCTPTFVEPQKVQSTNYLQNNLWQLTETFKDETSTIADSSIWDFEETRVFVDGEMYRLTVLGSYMSIGFEVPKRYSIEFVGSDSLILLSDSVYYQYMKL